MGPESEGEGDTVRDIQIGVIIGLLIVIAYDVYRIAEAVVGR